MYRRKRSSSRGRKSYGRKRSSSRGYKSVRPVAKSVGYTRVAGNYGRFRGMSKPELKWFDGNTHAAKIFKEFANGASGDVVYLCPAADTIPDPTGGVSLNLIAQGPGASQRVGRKITARHLEFKLRIQQDNVIMPVGSRAPSVCYRWVIGIDHQCNGTDITASMVLSGPTGTVVPGGDTSITNTMSNRTLANSKRFTILCDKKFCHNSPSLQAASDPMNGPATVAGWVIDKHFSTALNLPIIFSDPGVPTITNVQSNNIFAFVLIDSIFAQAGTTPITCEIDGAFRLRYSDV